MPSKDIYPESTLQELRERVSYEDLLLQTVYNLTEDELFPVWPDEMAYEANTPNFREIHSGRCHGVMGDWRQGFLLNASPLIFVTSFKLLDMLFEWILERNDKKTNVGFKTKLNCRVPCDYLPRRSWPLFKARAVLRGLLASNDLESTS